MHELKITYKKTKDLIPYARNARKHSDAQVTQIAASIQEFGFNAPIAVDKNNVVIYGHGRLLAAKKLGLETVPTVSLEHLTENQRKAYILADNQIALNSTWDDAFLQLELTELKESEYDLNKIGFSTDELDSMLKDIETDLPELSDLDAPQKKYITFNFARFEDFDYLTNLLETQKMNKEKKEETLIRILMEKQSDGC